MPLDGHSYLISQGWSGHGTGLRKDAIIRPLAIPQKRTLAGLGKDRDEAFPFWDHLFSVAAKTIQVKLSKDDDDGDSSDSDTPPVTNQLDRTTTGILSNKAPKQGTPASGSATPTLAPNPSFPSLLSSSSTNLLLAAKREAAKRTLYSRFFRGPVLGPESSDAPDVDAAYRTTTGILSNKAPKQGTPASGSATPTLAPNPSFPSLLSSSSTNLLLAAKREAAKRTLYSRFFRGPVLGPESSDAPDVDAACTSGTAARSLSTAKRPVDDWDAVIVNNVLSSSSSKTPMAIAKAKITTASDAAPPVLKTLPVDERKEKKSKRKVRDNEEKDTDKKQKKDKKRSREEDEDEDEGKRRKRDRKEAKKAVLATATSSSVTTDTDVEMTVTSSSSNPNSTTLNASEKDALGLKQKKKKRKTAD
ncbi:G patch domain-containing protein 4 [Leucoagaricus sp. SymC.cos]|nr:G patch domain-containing protein 4 [Leucoagaricus sp. SymC.cos]